MKYKMRDEKGEVIGTLESSPLVKGDKVTDKHGGSQTVNEVWQDRALGQGTVYVRENKK